MGTVWNDINGNERYDPGEGISNITVLPNSGTYYAITSDSGGYSIPISSEGTYTITFSGAVNALRSVTVGCESALLDLQIGLPPVTTTTHHHYHYHYIQHIRYDNNNPPWEPSQPEILECPQRKFQGFTPKQS